MSLLRRTLRTFAVSLLVVAAACASSEDAKPGSSSGASSSSGSSGQLGGDGGTNSEPADELKGCATDTTKATTLPLDLYVMFDSSGSMARLVADKKTQYAAATEA